MIHPFATPNLQTAPHHPYPCDAPLQPQSLSFALINGPLSLIDIIHNTFALKAHGQTTICSAVHTHTPESAPYTE
jgi:hypothetical protein